MKEPQPGLYADTSGTCYEATRTGKPLQWHLRKLHNRHGVAYMPIPPWPHETFARDVLRGVFTPIIPTI